MNQTQHNKRKLDLWLHAIFGLSSLALFAVFFSCLLQSHAIPGLNAQADKYYEEAKSEIPNKIEQARRANLIRGDIYDTNGIPLAVTTEVGGLPTFTEDYAYSSVVGTLTKQGHKYGIIGKYNSVLFTTTSNDEVKGASMTLTLDSELQKKAYALLTEPSQHNEDIPDLGEGAIIILNAKTGAILAMASNPSYNANTFDEDWSITKERTDSVLMPAAYRLNYSPGSVFKILDSAAIVEAGIQNEIVSDTGSIVIDGNRIHNDANYSYGEISMFDAFQVSSNVYFIDRITNVLGRDTLNDMANRFLLSSNIPLDFFTLTSKWELNENSSDFQVAQASIGQFGTEWSALQAAMVLQCIANNGTMLRPYLIEYVTAADGTVLYSGYESSTSIESLQEAAQLSKSLGQILSPDTAQILQAELNYARSDLYTKNGQQIGVKTGTAQTGKTDSEGNELYHSWIASYGPTETPTYVVVLLQRNTIYHGGSYMNYILDIYNWLL